MATGYLSNAPRVGQEEDRPDGLGGAIGRPRAAPLAHALAPQRSQQQQRVTAALRGQTRYRGQGHGKKELAKRRAPAGNGPAAGW